MKSRFQKCEYERQCECDCGCDRERLWDAQGWLGEGSRGSFGINFFFPKGGFDNTNEMREEFRKISVFGGDEVEEG